ncbi:MAG: sulfatase-like hydrolase/transferase, partial [Planctomycetes bacterium]|nr:sulfatase-like hydrolase/transferase [Planctomycetota bacterium]
KHVENMGLLDETVIIFTSDHGFYFGEHNGLFGKMVLEKYPDGTHPRLEDWDKKDGGRWAYSPLYEELARIPLFIYMPGVEPGSYNQLTSAVDVMPTVLDLLGQEIPQSVEGESLKPKLYDPSLKGREYTVSSIPFANPGDSVRSVDSFLRMLQVPTVTTVTTTEWSLLYSPDKGVSKLYNILSDPGQEIDLILDRPDIATELHKYLVKFMSDTNVADYLLKSRLELRL